MNMREFARPLGLPLSVIHVALKVEGRKSAGPGRAYRLSRRPPALHRRRWRYALRCPLPERAPLQTERRRCWASVPKSRRHEHRT